MDNYIVAFVACVIFIIFTFEITMLYKELDDLQKCSKERGEVIKHFEEK